jgi:hypothetical protein
MTMPCWSQPIPRVPDFHALYARHTVVVAYLSPHPIRGDWELIVGLHREEARRIHRAVPNRAYGERLGLRWLSMHRRQLDLEIEAYDARLPYHAWKGVVAGTP